MNAQTPYANTTADIVLNSGAPVPGEGGGVAYNPALQLYYANVAGLSSNPFETFNNTGTLLNSVTGNIDPRGAWWNPSLNQLEMNTYNGQGVYSVNLSPLGYALGTNVAIQSPTNTVPNAQSSAGYDWLDNNFVYYNAGSITRVNRVTNALVSTNVVTGLPATTVTAFTIGVFNVPNYEYALYDYINKRVYFVNKATNAYSGMTQLPLVTPGNQVMYNVGWANNRIFLCNTATRNWTGYPLFPDGCDTVRYEQVVNICSSQLPFNWNGKSYNTGGSKIDTFHWPAASVACDSVTYLTLNITPSYHAEIVDSIYEGNTYSFGNRLLYNTGTYDHTFWAANGCDSNIRLRLKVIPVEYKILDTTICVYDKYEFYNKAYNRQGFHTDTFVLEEKHIILRLNLTIRNRPNVKISLEGRSFDDLCIGERVTFLATGAQRYEWFRVMEPLNIKYFEGNKLLGYVYDSLTNLKLRGFDELGCFNDVNYTLQGENCCKYFIPTAFTPNGDGVNDVYQVMGIQPKTFRMLIFNRLGNLVYQSETIESAWSGLDRNGNELAADVYYYHITGQCFDGTEINEKGDVTLLR